MTMCTCNHQDTSHSANGANGAYVGRGKGRCMFCACELFKGPTNVLVRVGALGLLLLALTLSGCPKPIPPPVDPTPDADAGAIAQDADAAHYTCASVCQHGDKLGCAWSRPTPDGATCLDVCFNANRDDGPFRWDFACRTRAKSCAVLCR
jgi:hypothetical protein